MSIHVQYVAAPAVGVCSSPAAECGSPAAPRFPVGDARAGRSVHGIARSRGRPRRRLAAVSRSGRTGRLGRNRAAAAVERVDKRHVEGAGSRARMVISGRRRRPRLVDDGGGRGRHLAAGARLRRRDRAPGRQHRGLPQAPVAAAQPEEQLGVADADRRRRSRLRALRRRRHGGADDRRRGGLEGALSLRVAAWRRRVAGDLRRSADLQLRRQRRRVRRRARQADRTRCAGRRRAASLRTRPTRRRW